MVKIKEEEKELSKLATTRILTPADFAKLEELKAEAGLAKMLGKSNNRYVLLNFVFWSSATNMMHSQTRG